MPRFPLFLSNPSRESLLCCSGVQSVPPPSHQRAHVTAADTSPVPWALLSTSARAQRAGEVVAWGAK